jgi:hypothetical protein
MTPVAPAPDKSLQRTVNHEVLREMDGSAAMQKWAKFVSLALLICGSIAPNVALSESLEKASPKDVAMLLNAATGMNSAYLASLIGETHGRVYIEYVTALHASSLFSKEQKRVVYWLPRSEITDEQLARFKNYKSKQEPQK